MTLDPVHFREITRLAGGIRHSVDERDHREFAGEVFEGWLDPLVEEGTTVIEPLGEQRRRKVAVDEVALQDDEFPSQHGLDAGTINPTTFKNGLVVEVAQAAMSAVPSDLELHRNRTVVLGVHSNDATMAAPEGGDGWFAADGGHMRKRVLHVPSVNSSPTAVVHALALYLAEIEHVTAQGVVDDLLVLDGPIYPKGLLTWANAERELQELLEVGEDPRGIVARYLELVEAYAAADTPLCGFVKNPASSTITRVVRARTGNAPWVNDAAFFTQVLERGDYDPDDGFQRDTDYLTFTNWFASRGGTDGMVARRDGPFDVPRDLDPEAYEVTFAVIYDPRTDTVYRLEAPRVVTADEDRRERLLRQVLKDVAVSRGPPRAVAKADRLARIGRGETDALRRALETTLDSELDTNYDDDRWGSSNADSRAPRGPGTGRRARRVRSGR